MLLRRTPLWQPWLAWTVLGLGAVAVAGLLVAHRAPPVLGAATVTVAVLAGLGAPTAYALATAATAHTGAIPSAGPSGGMGPGGFGRGFGGGGGPGGGRFAPGGWGASGTATGGSGAPGSGASGTGARGTGSGGGTGAGASTAGAAAGGAGGRGNRSGPGGIGGLLGSPTPSAQVVALLQRDAGAFTWAAAAVGSNTAAGYQLAAGLPVMAVGGFNGTDPSPTLAQFQALVAAEKVHWFVGGAGSDMTRSGGSDDAAAIARWVQQHYPATRVGGTTLYDLSGAAL